MHTRAKGGRGEELAIKYLEGLGYSLLEKNIYSKGSELDLVFTDNEFIVFVEVKSLRANSPFTIYESLTAAKKKSLKRGINNWLLKNKYQNVPWRLDFLGIITNDDKHEIEHFKFVEI